MKNSRNEAQTLVVGSLLLLSLAVVLTLYIQTAIFPQLNKKAEISELSDSTDSMKKVKSEISMVATLGGSRSLKFDNRVSYLPQPAGFPDQFGQLNTRGSEPILLRNKNTSVSFVTGTEFGPSESTELRYQKIISYQPKMIRLPSEGRRIIYDNTVVGVTESGQDNFTTVSSQNIIKGDNINIFHLVSSGESGFKSPEEQISFTRVKSGRETIEPDTDNSNPIEIKFRTSYNEDTWESILEDELVENGGNVGNINKSGNEVTIHLSRTPSGGDYKLNYARILVR